MSKLIKVEDTPRTKFEYWLKEVNEKLKVEFEKQFKNIKWRDLQYSKGRNYIKIVKKDTQTSVWGFVCMKDNPNKAQRAGDLLKAASWNAPAKHSRGNIFDGTASYGLYGPNYLK